MSLQAVGSATQARLGSVVVSRMELEPPPLKLHMGSILLVILGVLLVGGGAFLALEAVRVGAGMGAAGVSCLVPGIVLLVRRAALRCELTLHEQGLVVSRKGHDEAIAFNQVRDFSLAEKEQLNNGTYAGMLRTLRFQWEGRSTRVSQFAAAGVEDRFGPVLSEVVRKLADTVEARLKSGSTLEGKGWALDSRGLHVRAEAPVRLVDMAGVGLFEGQVSFWRAGEELPFFSALEGGPNARLLGVLAQRHLSNRERPMAGPLGRILFQRKMGTTGQVLCGVLGVVFFLGGTLAALALGFDGNWLGVALSIGIGWSMTALFITNIIGRFRVHELGVTQRSLFGTRTLRYSDLRGFQFGATRHYYNGAYTGTALSMRFTPGPGLKAIHHTQNVRGNDSDLDSLREQVSGMVAGQLFERWKQGEAIAWGSSARFTKTGLVVQATKLFGKGEERLAPYNAGLRYTIEQGSLNLFIGNESKAAMTVECSAENFYPGLKILGVLCSREEEDESRSAG